MKATLILRATLVALYFITFAAGTATAEIVYQTVTVGDPGNAGDETVMQQDQTTGYGSVSYTYAIGKYEVTLAQYTTFLNAVAAADPNGLYNPNMATNLNIAGIARLGSSGSYVYSVTGDGNRPVTYVSMLDAMRMANWIHNGQAGAGTTETGAYTLSLGQQATHNPGAKVWIPTENEWFKAAYYDPTVAGANKYWQYATRSNSAPGNVMGPGANQANYYNGVYSVTQSGTLSDPQNYLTAVGAFSGSASYYNTFDQNGNAFELNEAVIGNFRGLRGGAWWDPTYNLESSDRNMYDPLGENFNVGFRFAAIEPVPEPSGLLNVLLCLGLAAMRRRR